MGGWGIAGRFGCGSRRSRFIGCGWVAPFPNLYPEEAYYWNYAQHLDLGYLDHPPMVAWLIHLGTTVFGNTERGCGWRRSCSLVTSVFVFG